MAPESGSISGSEAMELIILLCGRDKSTQQQDIELAKQLDKEMKVSK